MLCQTEEPVIGLHYVEELMPETNRDAYPPHYACGLCNVAAAPATRDGDRFQHFLPVKVTNNCLPVPVCDGITQPF